MGDARVGIGILGAGDISRQYIECLKEFEPLNLVGIASQSLLAGTCVHGLESFSLQALLACKDIDLIVNLTTPLSHAGVTGQALQAGKHVYSEKPLAHTLAQATDLLTLAESRKLVLACAPATHLGPAQQTARMMMDSGELGELVGASATVVYAGPDRWHHSPAALFGPAAGPLFDLGIYYVAAFVHWFGSVRRVSAAGRTMQCMRQVHAGPRAGQTFAVEVPTHVAGWIEFETGLVATLTTSFDSPGTRASSMEIYGTQGSLAISAGTDGFTAPMYCCQTYGVWNLVEPRLPGWSQPWWVVGIVDTIEALLAAGQPRACPSVALHILEVLTALEASCQSASTVAITSTCKRPPGLGPGPIDQQFPALTSLQGRLFKPLAARTA